MEPVNGLLRCRVVLRASFTGVVSRGNGPLSLVKQKVMIFDESDYENVEIVYIVSSLRRVTTPSYFLNSADLVPLALLSSV